MKFQKCSFLLGFWKNGVVLTFLPKAQHFDQASQLVRARLQPMCFAAFAAPALATRHPYQSTYFNATVGGVAGAQDRYETDYWIASYTEAMDWVAKTRATRSGRLAAWLPGARVAAISGHAGFAVKVMK